MDPQQTPLARDRCVFTSVLLLGGLFVLSASPRCGLPFISALVIVGVPLLTFSVAAPTRLGALRELKLAFAGFESLVLQSLLRMVGRKADAFRVRDNHRSHVESAYLRTGGRLAAATAHDPLRLHHARRLASFATLIIMMGTVGLPFIFPNTYTYGSGLEVLPVFLLDLVVFGVVGRLVSERAIMRLFESTHAFQQVGKNAARIRTLPLSIILGGALGAVASLVVVSAGSVTCAIDTVAMAGGSLIAPAFWFMQATAPQALPFGICLGVVMGIGMALAQPRKKA